ncbi:MAG: chemotaxis protein CheW [Acidobacteria bacterium]|nr:chemotaxis protein CheW [Acidobacteriota bacterium]
MSDSERDDLFLGFDDQSLAEGGALPMDGLLAELLGNWQDVELPEAEMLAGAQPAAVEEDTVSVSALMDRLLLEDPFPAPEGTGQPLIVEPEAVAAGAEPREAERTPEHEPEPFVDLESLSIVLPGEDVLRGEEPPPAEPAGPVADLLVTEPQALEAARDELAVSFLADLHPELPALRSSTVPAAVHPEEAEPAAEETAAEAVNHALPPPEAEGQRDDGALRLLLGTMKRELAESTQPRQAEPPPGAGRVTERFLAFQLAGESYAVPLTRVMETERLPKLTTVPGLPAFVLGVANLRGAVLPLVDLSMLLELESTGRPHDARILVVRPSPDDSPVALVVDALQGVAMLAREELHRTPHWLDGRTTPFLEGIGSHKGRLLSVLDLDRVFAASELREQPAAY